MERNDRFSLAAAVGALVLGLSLTAQAKIIYVDDDAMGRNDGSTWDNAHRHLQDAFFDAYRYLQDTLGEAGTSSEPVEIRVAQGVYRPDRNSRYPDGTRDRNASFCLLDGVAVKGGFAGVGAADPNARDIIRYESILSGDLAGNDAPVKDPCDLLTEPTRAENSHHLVTAEPCSRSAVLEGFTIRAATGCALFLPETVTPCRPSVRNCLFIDNSSSAGAAACVYVAARPELIDCVFLRNVAWSGAGALQVTSGRAEVGAGDFVVRGCIFAWNVAAGANKDMPGMGSAVTGDGGAASIALESPSIMEDCTFVGNTALIGGAVRSNRTENIVNCRFIQNTASEAGGAIYVEGPGTTLVSCTLSGNMAPDGRACYVGTHQGGLTVINTILWDGGDEISLATNAAVDVAYSDIEGGWPGEGNIDADPLFANPIHWDPNTAIIAPGVPLAYGDYHLKSQAGRWDPNSVSWIIDPVTSPCIDAGDPNSAIGAEPEPNGGRINMGAYGGTAEASKSYFGQVGR
jgi:predicted outer membrane repeat protein